MPEYHAVYVTELGVSFIEKAQSYSNEKEAVEAAARVFSPQRDSDGNLHYIPVSIETIEGRFVSIPSFAHIQILTPEELENAKKEEQKMKNGGVLPDEQ